MKKPNEGVRLVVPLKRDSRLVPMLRPFVTNGIVVSRDPMVISGYRQDEVSVLSLDENGDAVFTRPEFNTYGASVNMIRMSMLDERMTIPEKVYEHMRSINDIQEVSRTFGDSVEKVLWIKTLLDRRKKND